MSCKLLDCTLRDGAHINNGEFGSVISNNLVQKLDSANIDLIEIGFLEPKSSTKTNTYFKNIYECESFFSDTVKAQSQYGLMLRTDRCELNALSSSKLIDFFRIAFYPDHLNDVVLYARELRQLGYEVYLNLIASPTYDHDLLQLVLQTVSKEEIRGVSIVDTYGQLNSQNLIYLIDQFCIYLSKEVTLGLHLHENLSNSMLLIEKFCSIVLDRPTLIDASIYGMGRVPGNVPTELAATFLAENYARNFDISGLFEATAEVKQFKKDQTWGYSPLYAYSATLGIDRSYAEFLENKKISMKRSIEILDLFASKQVPVRFNSSIAEEIINLENASEQTEFI